VVSDDKLAVFAANPRKNDIFRIYTLRDSDRQIVLKKHDKHQEWYCEYNIIMGKGIDPKGTKFSDKINPF
jgi:hypothetical protein